MVQSIIGVNFSPNAQTLVGNLTGGLIEICLAIISEEINKRTLFIKDFPPGTKPEELKKLSDDIQEVRLKYSRHTNKAFW